MRTAFEDVCAAPRTAPQKTQRRKAAPRRAPVAWTGLFWAWGVCVVAQRGKRGAPSEAKLCWDFKRRLQRSDPGFISDEGATSSTHLDAWLCVVTKQIFLSLVSGLFTALPHAAGCSRPWRCLGSGKESVCAPVAGEWIIESAAADRLITLRSEQGAVMHQSTTDIEEGRERSCIREEGYPILPALWSPLCSISSWSQLLRAWPWPKGPPPHRSSRLPPCTFTCMD